MVEAGGGWAAQVRLQTAHMAQCNVWVFCTNQALWPRDPMQHLGLWTCRAAWGHVCTQCSVWPCAQAERHVHVVARSSAASGSLHKKSSMCTWLQIQVQRMGLWSSRAAWDRETRCCVQVSAQAEQHGAGEPDATVQVARLLLPHALGHGHEVAPLLARQRCCSW